MEIVDIKQSINFLQDRKSALVQKKRELEAQNAGFKNRIRTAGQALPQVEYNAICRNQSDIKKELAVVEAEIAEVNSQLRYRNVMEHEAYTAIKGKGLEERLEEMKRYYLSFASDRTRVSSMRAMASEVVERIEALLK